jgi:PST family polysaccharide transporter
MLQIVNYLFQFLTMPYLSRVLNPEHFGLVLFSLAFTNYFTIFCDYGFNLTATKQVAINAHDPQQLSRLVSEVTTVKLCLLLVSLVVNLLIIASSEQFRHYWFLYVLNFAVIANSIFCPAYLFQGLQKMGFLTIIQFGNRLSAALLIFVVIHSDQDYYWWSIITATSALLSAGLAQFFLIKIIKISYIRPSLAALKQQLVNGWHVFLSTIAVSIYANSNSVILGLMTNTIMVAYYVAAEKISNALNNLLLPLTQALFPHFAQLIAKDKHQGIQALQRAFWVMLGIGLTLTVSLWLAAPWLVRLMYGQHYVTASTGVLRILALIPLLTCINNLLGTQTMLTFGLNKPYARIILLASIFDLGLLFSLVPQFTYIGAAVSVVGSELLIAVLLAAYLWYAGIKVWRGKLSNQYQQAHIE